MPHAADFWNDRFAADEYVYGEQPNAFVRTAAPRWLTGNRRVGALGAGEGRNAVFLARQGHDVTAVDYAAEGLRKTRQLAEAAGVALDTIQADVRTWTPEQTWEAVVVTFLHLPPAERSRLYELIQAVLAPGGVLVAEWFRPEQRTEGYTSGGPPAADLMVPADELRNHFSTAGIDHLATAEPTLAEGPHHQGPAATVRFVWERQ